MADIIGDDAGWDAVQAAVDAHSPAAAVPAIEYGVMSWVRYEAPDLPTHLVPTWDIQGHALCPRTCPCRPRLDDETGMYVHNAFDGRERYGYGKEKWH